MDRAILLVYDIPTMNGGKSAFPNPSGQLKRFAFRLNLSAWMIPHERIPNKLIEAMRAKGCSVEVVRFDEKDITEIRRLGASALVSECNRIRASLEKSIERLKRQIAVTEKDGAKVKYYSEETRKYADKMLKTAKRSLACAEEATIAFDITADSKEIFTSMRQYVASRQDMIFSDLAKMVETNLITDDAERERIINGLVKTEANSGTQEIEAAA
jgi:hypothetical protein